ncbi:hypothetical protein JCM17960_05470 [Magnetospira thiophila]
MNKNIINGSVKTFAQHIKQKSGRMVGDTELEAEEIVEAIEDDVQTAVEKLDDEMDDSLNKY